MSVILTGNDCIDNTGPPLLEKYRVNDGSQVSLTRFKHAVNPSMEARMPRPCGIRFEPLSTLPESLRLVFLNLEWKKSLFKTGSPLREDDRSIVIQDSL